MTPGSQSTPTESSASHSADVPPNLISDSQTASHRILLSLVAACGFLIGAWGYPSWQIALESAQISAGVVPGPTGTNRIFLGNAQTILDQLLEIGLRTGLSERDLSVALSGVTGSLAYVSSSLVALASGGSTTAAVAAPVLLHLAGPILGGVTYPIMLFGTTHTYGMIGLSLSVAILGLFGWGRFRSALFLAGLLPSIHPVHGAFLLVSLGLACLWERRRSREILRAFWRSGAAGLCISGISLIVHFARNGTGAMATGDAASGELVGAFIRLWDNHRRTFSFLTVEMALVGTAIFLASLNIITGRALDPRPKRIFMKTLIVMAALSFLLSAAYWLPATPALSPILTIIPSRFFNLLIFAAPTLLLGICSSPSGGPWGGVVAALFAVLVLLRPQYLSLSLILTAGLFALSQAADSRFARPILSAGGLALIAAGAWWLSIPSIEPQFFGRLSLPRLLSGGALAMVGLLITVVGLRLRTPESTAQEKFREPWTLPFFRFWPNALSILAAIFLISVIRKTLHDQAARADSFRPPEQDSALFTASKGRGKLLTCSDMRAIQLRTQRPILLDGSSLDGLSYAPNAGPEMARTLSAIYGIDLLNPPEEIKRMRPGGLLRDSGRELFESRTPEDWAALARSFEFQEVLCWSNWRLQLQETARSREFVLYVLPREPEPVDNATKTP